MRCVSPNSLLTAFFLPDSNNCGYVLQCGECCPYVAHAGYVEELVAVALGELAVGGIDGVVCHYLAEGMALVIGTLLGLDEVEAHLAVLQHQALGTQLFAKAAQAYEVAQVLGFLGHSREVAQYQQRTGHRGGWIGELPGRPVARNTLLPEPYIPGSGLPDHKRLPW